MDRSLARPDRRRLRRLLFCWDAERRLLVHCELDAAFFHLYGLGRDEAESVMDTFPIVRRRDEQVRGEYRTKRVILEIYDAMEEAIATGHPYQTRLDPPSADPRVAHQPRPQGSAQSISVAGMRDRGTECELCEQ